MMLNIIPGGGRAFRSTRYVAFLSEHNPALSHLLSIAPDNLWEHVQALPQASTGSAALVVLDLDQRRYFRTGSIDLKVDGTMIDPTSQSGTFEPTSVVECGNCESAATVTDTFLNFGYIAADGFLLRPLGIAPASPSTDRPMALGASVAEPAPSIPAEAPDGRAVPVSTPESGSSSIFDDPDIDLSDIGRAEPAADQPIDERLDTSLEDRPVGEQGDGPRSSADVTPTTTTTTTTTTEPPEPPNPADAGAERAASPTGWNFREPGEPLPSSSQHEVNQPPTAEPANQDSNDHDVDGVPPDSQPTTLAAILDVTDVGLSYVAVGALIGRYPDKHQVPENYVAIRVPGSDISRIHLEVWVDTAGYLRARDRGSANGATVTRETGTTHDLPVTEQGLELAVGDRIEFGSGTARFIGWTSGG